MENQYHLIWSEEFDQLSLNLSTWNYRYGNCILDAVGNIRAEGWGNHELQYYTDDTENLSIKDNQLHITAHQKPSPAQNNKVYPYTSARIDTRNHFSFCYGKIIIRAKFPKGSGLWPAIWLMPQDSIYGSWPYSGEIDILEIKGRLPHKAYGTIHFGGCQPTPYLEHSCTLPGNGIITDFHDYELIWEEGSIQWLIDGIPYATATNWESDNPEILYPQPFNKPFYIILNLAVGGWFDEEGTAALDTTTFPATVVIDHIRVYQKDEHH